MKIKTLIILLLSLIISFAIIVKVGAATETVSWEITGLKQFLQRNVDLILNKELQQDE